MEERVVTLAGVDAPRQFRERKVITREVMNEAEGSTPPFSVLPTELMEMVWLFLPFPEMCFISEVCRSWRDAISPANERFWSLVHQAYVNRLRSAFSNCVV